MSPLWMKQKIILVTPSLTDKKVYPKKRLSQIIKKRYPSLKGISLLISKVKPLYVKGSMTVEASLLLPICIICFLNLAGILELLRFHGRMSTALWSLGNQMTVWGRSVQENVEELPDWSISYLLVNERLKSLLGKEYLESAPLEYGAEGLNYLRSDYVTEEECLDIVVTYQIKPIIAIGPFSNRRMCNRYFARCWTGYDVTEQKIHKYVYMVPKGEVWHADQECSYLYHVIDTIPREKITATKNADGEYYTLCKNCEDEDSGAWVYVTEEGEKYHLIRNCTAIYKNIQTVQWYEGFPYRACSRCASEE